MASGDVVGTKNNKGHLICRADYRILLVHRLAWYLYYGDEPPPIIDHKNGDGCDNRIENLRAATDTMNRANSRKKSSSKGRGVYVGPLGQWKASLRLNGKTMHLGTFDTKEKAEDAYRKAAEKQFGEFAFHHRLAMC